MMPNKEQMNYMIKLLVNADNAIDVAHAQRCPLPFLSCMVDDCMKRGLSVQEGGAVYNFNRPSGVWRCQYGGFVICHQDSGV